MSALRLFLSTVTSELRSYRDILSADLKGPLLEVKVQEDFIHMGGDTLSLLDDYIAVCDGVIHLIGDATGACPAPVSVQRLLQRYPDFAGRVPMLADLVSNAEISYTQWEAYLTLYHGKTLFLYQPSPEAPRDPEFVADARQKESQQQHLQRLQSIDRWAGTFLNHERLSTKVYQSLFNQHGSDRLPCRPSTAVISTPRIPYDHLKAEKLIGRERELARLDKAWADELTRVVIIRAWGGVGKTALVAAWLAEMAARGWRGAERVFDWSFYLQGTRPDGEEARGASADAFLAEALKFFGAAEPYPVSTQERGAMLARLAAERPSLLILDGLEPLQYPPGAAQAGQIKDPGVSTLLKCLARQNVGLCIVTTREKVDDLKTFGRVVDNLELSHLTEEAGSELLKSLGVIGPEKERRSASREVKGHALTLQLMGRYLALAHAGDIRKRDLFEFTEADDETQGGHAFRVLKAYETWLSTSGESGRRQLAILRLLGLFDRPADPGCLAALREPPVIVGLTEELASLSDAQWNIAVKRLEEVGLVTPVAYEARKVAGYNEEQGRARLEGRELYSTLPEPKEFRPGFRISHSASSLEAHPLLRAYFARQLRRDANAAWQAGHRRLFVHLQASVPYWPEGIDGLGPLYQAVAHGCQAGLEQQVWIDVYLNRILRGPWPDGVYSTRKLGAIGADLGAEACFFTEPWRTPSSNLTPAAQAGLLGSTAISLLALGRVTEAVEPVRASLEMRVAKQDWQQAAHNANNLSQLELTLGEIAAAVADGEQSVTFVDRIHDPIRRMTTRSTYATALHQANRLDEALHWFREAEKLQAERQPENPWLHSTPGYRYCDILLADVERNVWRVLLPTASRQAKEKLASWELRTAEQKKLQTVCEGVTRRAQYASEIAIRHQWLLDTALGNLTLARTAFYAALLDPSSPLPSCDSAVDGLRESGHSDYLPSGLLTRAWARWLQDDEAGCWADLDEAWEIAEPGPMRLHMADILLTRARLFRDRDALAQARALIEQCGYGRRLPELADAEEALA